MMQSCLGIFLMYMPNTQSNACEVFMHERLKNVTELSPSESDDRGNISLLPKII
jgi:hypothetical protein